MPQWDFLDFVSEQARRYAVFQLQMQAEVTGLIEEDGRVVGVRAETPSGPLSVRADLVIGADGRHSTVREKAGLVVDDLGAPMDVLWMQIPRDPDDPGQILLRFDAGRILVLFNRADYWQCGFVIAKGGFDEIQRRGLPALREEIARLAPYLRARTDELRDWADIKLLTVAVDRLQVWHRPGLLCIGDAAHAMSPIGGVGINLAIQDAVAAANILAPRFLQASSRPGFPMTICAPFSAVASSRRGRPNDCRCLCKTGSSAACSRAAQNYRRHCRCSSSPSGRSYGGFRRV
jgi:2-polyprenyl-6-methoxyphenol hydroxylase-like FAD-dependent oxidoreductase